MIAPWQSPPALEAYRFDDAANRLYAFVWGTFCDWYLEFTKPIMQGGGAVAQAETKATIGWALAQIVHLLHPIMPYVTEEIWAQLGGKDAGLLLTAPWPDLAPDLHDPDARGGDGMGGRGEFGDPRGALGNECAGRGASAVADQGCRCRPRSSIG